MTKVCVEIPSGIYKKLLDIALEERDPIGITASRLLRSAIDKATPKRVKVNKYAKNAKNRPKESHESFQK